MPLLRTLILLVIMSLAAVSGPVIAAEKTGELIYKFCFPPDSGASKNVKECNNEDCGLKDEPSDRALPTIRKNQKFAFLGATDYGAIWGSGHFRAIGDDRVRFLLYVLPTAQADDQEPEARYSLIPDRVIQTVFFSSFNEHAGSAVTVSYRVKQEPQERREPVTGILQMVDLHCTAKKMKLYDNHTLYYRASDDRSKDGEQCVELLWEKPETPLQWQQASSMTIDILSRFYCSSTP